LIYKSASAAVPELGDDDDTDRDTCADAQTRKRELKP
jgi:hypothetical protein